MTTHDTIPDLEGRLRAALAARADQVRPEDLEPAVAPVVELRPAWRSPWVLLATAAVVLLVLGVVVQGVGGRPRSDRIAPQPDRPQLTLPADVGRDWKADGPTNPAEVDLDGDGTPEEVVFLSEPTKEHDGRVRMQTTLSSTGEETWGIAEPATTIGVNAMGTIDADGDGDEELVLSDEGIGGDGTSDHPLVFDLRDGLLVELAVDQPELLRLGNFPVEGTRTEFYEMARNQGYGVRDHQLWSTRSVNAFAISDVLSSTRPFTMVFDSWTWRLDDDGVLHPDPTGCVVETPRGTTRPCPEGARDSLPEVAPASTTSYGPGETAAFAEGYPEFDARIADDGSAIEATVRGGATSTLPLDLPDPRVDGTAPTGVFFDGVSLLVRSSSDPSQAQVLITRGDELVALDEAGDVPLGSGTTADGADHRTWVTANGTGRLVTVVRSDDGTWQAWDWQMVDRRTIATLPMGEVCFADVDDPSTARAC